MSHVLIQNYLAHTAATYPSSASSSMGSSSARRSPSFARRRALREADEANQTRVIDSYPLAKYIVIAQRLFGYFQKSFEELNLDEAYVYGMRFSQLGLTTLPKHREWATAGKETRDNLRSQVAKVLSRLETIKRRMDEEETAKLRARMLARAEEETRRQNRFHLEQEQGRIALGIHQSQWNGQSTTEAKAMMEFSSSSYSKNVGHSYSNTRFQNNALKTNRGKKATKKLRKLFGLPKSSKKASKIEEDGSSVSQPVLPSLTTIRQSRAQYELHPRKNPTSPAHAAPRYTIEQLPVVEDVTLRLHPTNTPSLLNLQYDPSSDETLQNEFDETEKQPDTEIPREAYQEEMKSSIVPPVVGGLETSLLQTAVIDSYQISSIPDTSGYTSLPLQDRDETSRHTQRKEIELNEILFTNDDAELAKIDSNDVDSSSPSVSSGTVEKKEKILTGRKEVESKELLVTNDGVEVVQIEFKDVDVSSSPVLSDSVDTKERILAGITHRLFSTQYSEKGLVDRYELVLNELRKKLVSMYTGDHAIIETTRNENHESINSCETIDSNPKAELATARHVLNGITPVEDHIDLNTFDQFDAFLEEWESIEEEEKEEEKSLSAKECDKNRTNPDAFDQFDAFLAKRESIEEGEKSLSVKDFEKNNTNLNNFAKFDAFLAKWALAEEGEDRSYITELEEGITGGQQVYEEQSYLGYSVIEETLADEDIYLEYTVAEESVETFQTKSKVENKNTSDLLMNSPTCVASDRIVSSYDKSSQMPGFQSANERLQKFPSVNLIPSMDNDEMTYITMDTYLVDIDANKKDSLEEEYRQRIKKVLHKDLWKTNVDIVGDAMELLNEIVKNRDSSKVVVAEYGGVMAIVRTMIGCQDDEAIQFLCIDTLGLLASEPENRSMINDMGVVPIISRCMTRHPKSQRIQDAARDSIAAVHSE